jgi:hypothetical protein
MELAYDYGRTVYARVKSDGWVIAWLDRSAEFSLDVDHGYQGDPITRTQKGWFDFADGWPTAGGQSTIKPNPLTKEIGNLIGQLDNSDVITYSTDMAGLYNYQYPDTEQVTLFTSNANGSTSGFSYTSDTTLHAAVAMGTGELNYANEPAKAFFEDVTLANAGDLTTGTYDLLANDELLQSGTEYQVSLNDGTSVQNSVHVLILWS